MSPLARNWFFGTDVHGLRHAAELSATRGIMFVPAEATPAQFWRGMLIAALVSCLMMWLGTARRARDAEGEAVTQDRHRAILGCCDLATLAFVAVRSP